MDELSRDEEELDELAIEEPWERGEEQDIENFEDGDYACATDDGSDKEDEDVWPAKLRKLLSQPVNKSLKSARGHNS